MTYAGRFHHRRSIRLQGYDYTRSGAYFVTTCVQMRECLFGSIVDGNMLLNGAGLSVLESWQQLPNRFASVRLDAFVVMQNHIHGIIFIDDAATDNAPASISHVTLGQIMRVFKSMSAIAVNKLLDRSGSPLWQRNYYEHIIRDEVSLDRIRQYIVDNPANWHNDEDNPAADPIFDRVPRRQA